LAQFSPEEQTQDWHDLVNADNDEIVYVAEAQEGEIVGYALGRPQASGGVHYAGELVALHVLPSHQRQGVGRRLFAAITAHLQQQGCASLVVWVLALNPARAFYEQWGGELAGSQRLDIDGAEVEEVAYGWPDIEQLRSRLVNDRQEC
jgi:GNAT superfamily N-acetyltransferase